MKKIILLSAFLLSCILGQAQVFGSVTVMNTVTATATGNYQVKTGQRVQVGSIQILTSSDWNGTTGTAVLEYSNAASPNSTTDWTPVYADDNTTALSFTLSGASGEYTWVLKTVNYAWYRIVYTKGNGTVGTVTGTMFSQ